MKNSLKRYYNTKICHTSYKKIHIFENVHYLLNLTRLIIIWIIEEITINENSKSISGSRCPAWIHHCSHDYGKQPGKLVAHLCPAPPLWVARLHANRSCFPVFPFCGGGFHVFLVFKVRKHFKPRLIYSPGKTDHFNFCYRAVPEFIPAVG